MSTTSQAHITTCKGWPVEDGCNVQRIAQWLVAAKVFWQELGQQFDPLPWQLYFSCVFQFNGYKLRVKGLEASAFDFFLSEWNNIDYIKNLKR